MIGVIAFTAFTLRDIDLNNPEPVSELATDRHATFAPCGFRWPQLSLVRCSAEDCTFCPQYLRTIQTYDATQTGFFYFIDGLASLVGYYLMIKLAPHFGASQLETLRGLGPLHHRQFLSRPSARQEIHAARDDCHISRSPCKCIQRNANTGNRYADSPRDRPEIYFFSKCAAIYLFFRSLGASIGVSRRLAALDLRQTLHSSPAAARRCKPTESTVRSGSEWRSVEWFIVGE